MPAHVRVDPPTGSWSPSLPVVLLFAVLLGLPAGLGAQVRSIRFERIGLEQGLSSATVNCILQDRKGFLWFGTQDGLNRYDGYGFHIDKHDPTDPESLPANWIETLLEDESGDLWVGTQGGGLARWRRATDTFERFRHHPDDPTSLPGPSVRALHFDRTGALWIGTFRSGLARLAPATGELEHFRHDPSDAGSLSDDRVRAIYEDRAGNLWVGTLSGLDRFDAVTHSFRHFRHDPSDPASLSDDRVTAILEDHQGALWIATEGGLNRRPPGPSQAGLPQGASTFARYRHDPSDPASLSHDLVWALYEDSARRLWIGTDGGLSLLRHPTAGFDRYRHDAADSNSLSNDRVPSIFQDRGGVLWIGTQAGINKWNPAAWSFSHYRADPANAAGLSHNAVYAFSEDRAGRLWIGTWGGGLDVLDRSTGSWTHYRHDPTDPASLADDQVTALLHDREGVVWVGTSAHGIDRFEPTVHRSGSGAFRHFRHDPERPGTLSNDAVSALFEDRAGIVWAATFRGGLNRFDSRTETFLSFRHDPARPESLSEDSPTALAEDADGFLWIGTFSSGLNRFNPATEKVRRIAHDPDRPASLSNNTVYALHVDAAGILWVGTHAGLNKLAELGEAAFFRHYFESDGLASDLVYGIRSDADGRLWLATNNGLSRFDPRTETFKSYDESHGLQANEFNFGAHFRSAAGELFFGGVNGFNAFFPDRIEPNTHVPPVVLTSFTKINRPVRFERPLFDVDEISLTYRDYFFSLEFAALDYAAPEENLHRYKLEDFDPDWIDLGPERRVTFTNLDPGPYVLRLQGSNNDGVWNEEGTSIRLVVAPPPWRTWWAYTLYSLVFAATVLGFVRLHREKLRRERQAAENERAVAERERAANRQLRAVDKLKDEFFANTSHELRTPLHGITGLTESLIDGARGELSDDVRFDLSMVVVSGRRLATLVDDLLDFAKLRHGSLVLDRRPVDLRSLVDVILTLSRPLVGSKNLELKNAVPADLPAVNADESRLQQILHNLVGNAVKFTESGLVEISATARPVATAGHGGELVVKVSDTGIGIPRSKRERIFDAFEQADGSVEREHGGTGLGLAITRQLVELHGGSIWLESIPGEGSTFLVSLPVSEGLPEPGSPAIPGVSRIHVPEPETAAPAEVLAGQPEGPEVIPAREESRSPSRAGSILIVDDEPVIRQVLGNHLAARHYRVRQAPSGAEALRLLEEGPPDLVLLDIMMPKMSGYEVCREIRRKYSLEELPIIFLTAKDRLTDLVSGFSEGANDYLVKPIAKDELLARVETHLELLQVHRNLGQVVEEKSTQVKVLQGLLPICCSCKKIRDDEGYWNQIEVYINTHSEAEFTHGICPDCLGRLYGELDLNE